MWSPQVDQAPPPSPAAASHSRDRPLLLPPAPRSPPPSTLGGYVPGGNSGRRPPASSWPRFFEPARRVFDGSRERVPVTLHRCLRPCASASAVRHLVALRRCGQFFSSVVCAASHNDHGDCHSCPFFIVWVFTSTGYSYASRYSSENGTWDLLASSPTPSVVDSRPSVLVENVLYWPLKSKYILAYELGTCSLYHIECPLDTHNVYRRNVHITRTENGGPGLAAMTEFNLRLWAWETDAEGVSGWVLCKIIDLDAFLPPEVSPLPSTRNHLAGRPLVRILGFVEDDNLVFLWTIIGVFAVQLKSMQFKVVFEADVSATIFP